MSDTFAYTIGGTVQASSGIYIRRKADEQLLQSCLNGKYAYVLSARQVGKSSLMVNVAQNLRQRGVQAATVDLTAVGKDYVGADAWYCGVLYEIERKLGLESDVFSWWELQKKLTPSARFIGYFRSVILAGVRGPLVIFLDEIDTTLTLKFTDDFFAAIRLLYNMRSEEPEFNRLCFVLIGVAVPTDLIKNSQHTPFNIAERVDLEDFTVEDAAPLASGLDIPESRRHLVMDRVLYWTGGHPYLTQRLLRAIATGPERPTSESGVDAAVARTFLGDHSSFDNNLGHIADRFSAQSPLSYRMLSIYRNVLRGFPPVIDSAAALEKSYLKLSGIVRRKGALLVVRNRIYEAVFDLDWVNEQRAMRQERATRFALLFAGCVSLVAVVLGFYSWFQKRDLAREKALKEEAVMQRSVAEQQTGVAVRQTGIAQAAAAREADARKSAQSALDEAERQRRIAESKTREAEASGRRAVQAANQEAEQSRLAQLAAEEANTQRLLAEKNAVEAARKSEEAEIQRKAADANAADAIMARRGERGLRLISDADLLRLFEPNRLEDGMLLDVEAYNRTPGSLTTQALHAGLDKLLRKVGSLPVSLDQTAMALSDEGTVLAVAGPDGNTKSYTLPGLKPGPTLAIGGRPAFLAVTSQGIITGATANGPLKRPQFEVPLDETVLAMSQDGGSVATVSQDGRKVRYWRDGKVLGVLKHSSRVLWARFRGLTLDTLTEDFYLTDWSLRLDKVVQGKRYQLPKEMPTPTSFIRYTPVEMPPFIRYIVQGGGGVIAVASGTAVRLMNEQRKLVPGRTLLFLPGTRLSYNGQQYAILQHDAPVTALAIDDSSRFLATASRDGTARLWSLINGQEITRVKLEKPIAGMVLSADGGEMAVQELGGPVTLFSTEPGSVIARSAGSFGKVAFMPDGESVALVDGGGLPKRDRIWNWKQNTIRNVDFLSYRTSVGLVNGGQRLEILQPAATQTSKALPPTPVVQYSNMETGLVQRLEGATQRRAISANGAYVSTFVGGELRVHKIGVSEPLPGFSYHTTAPAASFTTDIDSIGPRVAIYENRVIHIVAAGASPVEIPIDTPVTALWFSPDGRYLAATVPGEIRIFKTDTWTVMPPIRQTGAASATITVTELSFSTDALYLAAAGSDNAAHVWETATGHELARLAGNSTRISGVAFSPDGKRVATTGPDGTRIWIWQPLDMIAEACGLVRKRQLDPAVWDKYLPGEPFRSTCPAK